MIFPSHGKEMSDLLFCRNLCYVSLACLSNSGFFGRNSVVVTNYCSGIVHIIMFIIITHKSGLIGVS